MPRKAYPSDERRALERRRERAFARVFTSIRNPKDPEHLRVFADPFQRGVWLALVTAATAAYAGRTGDVVVLEPGDLLWITGRKYLRHQMQVLGELVDALGYPMQPLERGARVLVRGLSENQGWTDPRERIDPARAEQERRDFAEGKITQLAGLFRAK